ncbi:MAG TPA: M28 family peptidase [Holophagaceae bacterium]|nr:M28 family peptidase [Geothrix sp.]HJW33147.1 M28 family peptidase [Holophagaceae bacterium]
MRALALPLVTLSLVAPLAGQAPAESRLRRDVAFLASPKLQGRGNGSPELRQAAEFIVKRQKTLGLKPKVQTFPFPASLVVDTAKADFIQGDERQAWIPGKDFQPLGLSGDSTPGVKPLTFLGYGVKTQGYDEFQGLDLKGRMAIIRRRVPEIPAFAHLAPGEKSLSFRLRRLQDLGVAGVLVIEEEATPRLPRIEDGSAPLAIAVLSVRKGLLDAALGDLEAVYKTIAESGTPQVKDHVFAPWKALSFDLRIHRKEGQVPNIATLLKGRDPKLKGEVVVLGAHLDHLGLGERHSLGGAQAFGLVHPGADDNASGSALLMELTRRLARKPARRPVLTLHFGGEEEGLLGSQFWLRNPTQDVTTVRFMVNFDMVGRLDPAKPALTLGGLGAPKAAVDHAADLAPKGWTVGRDLGAAVGGSDHMSFAQAKIPTFFFFTGLHDAYHRPTDTAETLNAQGLAQLADYAERVVRDLADAPALPAFDPETAKLPTQGRSPMRIAFGTIPDYSPNPTGFRISGVSKGGTAEAIGLQAGDILTSFGGKPTKDIQDYMAALGAFSPGDQVVIQWLRDGKPMEATATLKGRD